MSTERIIVRPAVHTDVQALSALGAETFRETFDDSNTPEDMARYLAESFSPEIQAAEIADPLNVMLVAERHAPTGGTTLVGYAQLRAGEVPPDVQGPDPLELKRLYILRAWHGRGVAQALMQVCLDTATARGCGTLWLGVWEHNGRAQAFYAKYGFVRVGQHDFVLGTDVQTDWLMSRPMERR
jgi:ribosomal protein S18 acetylase RimI-like enzyme